MSDSFGPVNTRTTPSSGGASLNGFVTSITSLPSRWSGPASRTASSATAAAHRQYRALAPRRRGVWRLRRNASRVRELGGLRWRTARDAHVVAVRLETLRERLANRAESKHCDAHIVASFLSGERILIVFALAPPRAPPIRVMFAGRALCDTRGHERHLHLNVFDQLADAVAAVAPSVVQVQGRRRPVERRRLRATVVVTQPRGRSAARTACASRRARRPHARRGAWRLGSDDAASRAARERSRRAAAHGRADAGARRASGARGRALVEQRDHRERRASSP